MLHSKLIVSLRNSLPLRLRQCENSFSDVTTLDSSVILNIETNLFSVFTPKYQWDPSWCAHSKLDRHLVHLIVQLDFKVFRQSI